MVAGHHSNSRLVALAIRARPLRQLPLWARYLISALLVLAFFQLRVQLVPLYLHPYLFFLPAIAISAFIFDRGSGIFATLLSTAVVVYFFIEPRNSWEITGYGEPVSAAFFVAVGVLVAVLIETLRVAVEDLAAINEKLDRSHSEIRHGANLLQTIIESTPEPLFVTDLDGRYVEVNSAFVTMLNAPREAVIGRWEKEFLGPGDGAKMESHDGQVIATGEPKISEELISIGAQPPRWFRITRAPWYGPDGQLAGVIGVYRDIDESKRTAAQLEAANAQKELLLRDINHRVKNHLQSVLSFLSMTRRRMPDEASKEGLQGAIQRLQVLSRVYERLDVSDGRETTLNVQDYLHSICKDLSTALLGLLPISIRVEAEDVHLESGRAVSVGLVVNEAIANAIKYAFPDDRQGSIVVRCMSQGDDVRLEIADDGIGVANRSPDAHSGQQLIRALAQQLGGCAEWISPPGTTVRVIFPQRRASGPAPESNQTAAA